jgi:hypothetical protein
MKSLIMTMSISNEAAMTPKRLLARLNQGTTPEMALEGLTAANLAYQG